MFDECIGCKQLSVSVNESVYSLNDDMLIC
jgi:hypothetical protein